MSKYRKHSIQEKRRRSKSRKQRKKLAKKYSEGSGRDPSTLNTGCEVNVKQPLMQNQPLEIRGTNDEKFPLENDSIVTEDK